MMVPFAYGFVGMVVGRLFTDSLVEVVLLFFLSGFVAFFILRAGALSWSGLWALFAYCLGVTLLSSQMGNVFVAARLGYVETLWGELAELAITVLLVPVVSIALVGLFFVIRAER